MSGEENVAARWFTRVVWVGIIANLGLAIPSLVSPARMLAFSNLPAATPTLWLRFSALLLILLSAFYVPAALNPQRYRLVAWLAVAARLAGVVFFVGFQPSEYHMLGYFDFVFFVPELVLLIAATRGEGQMALATERAGWRLP